MGWARFDHGSVEIKQSAVGNLDVPAFEPISSMGYSETPEVRPKGRKIREFEEP